MGKNELALDEAQRLISAVLTRADAPHGAAREVEMAKRYALGDTLDEIGIDFNLTRERVRQLINISGWRVPEIRQARRLVAAEEQQRKEDRDRQLVRQWSYANPGSPVQEAVEAFDLSESEVNRALGNRRNLHREAGGRKSQPQWSDTAVLDLLRKFHAETGSTVSAEFESWSVARGGPSRQTPMLRFGTWSAALTAAGIIGSYSVPRERRFSDNDLWAAVVEFFSFERENYSYQYFADWLSGREGMPSAAHIRHRLTVSWKSMSSVAQKVAAGQITDLDSDWVRQVRQQRDWKAMVPEELDHSKVLARAVADVGPVLTISSYNEWALPRGMPRGNNLMQKTGLTWTELVREAGGRTGTRGRGGKVSDAELLESLIEYMKTHASVRYTEYSQWARRHQLSVAKTLAKRFGSWDEATSAAARTLEERGAPTEPR